MLVEKFKILLRYKSVRSGHSCHRYHATLCYLPHAEKKNSVKNLRCLAANISLEKRLQELTSRRNLELESHRQFVVVINLVLATPATSMAPDRTGPAVPVTHKRYWQELSRDIQTAADTGNIRGMYDGITKALGPTQSKTAPLKSISGEVITDKGKQMERWVEHYPELYSRENSVVD